MICENIRNGYRKSGNLWIMWRVSHKKSIQGVMMEDNYFFRRALLQELPIQITGL
jgi:hypothetical protein